MAHVLSYQIFRRFAKSKCALALPVTFLILLVSTLGIVAVTYAFSVKRINLQSESLKVSSAKQNFLSLNDVILSTLWQPGSSGTFDVADSDGLTNIQPTNNVLTINISDNSSIDETIFNASVGKIIYELPYSDSVDTGLYLAGDSRTIVNESGLSLSQLCVASGGQSQELQLQYRPTVTYANDGLENGKAVNNIRIYVINLNSSDPISLRGELPLKISCIETQLTTAVYEVSYQPENLVITSQFGGVNGSVSVPISSTSQGSVINIETVISNVSIERSIL